MTDINELILSKIAELNVEIVKLTAKGLEPCSLAKDPGHPGDNWVTEEGGLPRYICNVAKHIKADGHTTSQAIAMAVSQIKKWIASPNTSAETKAKASAAIAEWERKRAGAHATVRAAHGKLAASGLEFEADPKALELAAVSADMDADESSEKEPPEGTRPDLAEDLQEALSDFNEAYTSLQEVIREVRAQMHLSASTPDAEVLSLASRTFSSNSRKKMSDSGVAMPDGSFPIPDKDALRRAIQSIGRAKNQAAVKAHIKRRARALGATQIIPVNW